MKPIIEVHVCNKDGVFTRTTLDFDVVMGISPYQMKIRGEDGKSTVANGTVLMLKNGKEMFVTDEYDKISDQWIKLTHPCVNVPEGSDAPHHVCGHGYAARSCGVCNHGSTFGA